MSTPKTRESRPARTSQRATPALAIDAHTHLLPPSFTGRRVELRSRDATFAELFASDDAKMATAEELIAAMDAGGIEASIAVGYGWCDPSLAREANDYLLDAAARYPGRIVPFVSVHPGWGTGAIAEVERCAAAGARGIGELHPTSQAIDLPAGDGVAPLMEAATRLGLPVMVHGSEPVGHAYAGKGNTTPARLLALIEAWPNAIIICAHWGGGLPFYAHMPEVRAALANVYFDSAASPFLYDADVFRAVGRGVGVDHMLFGSDFPLLPAERVIAEVRESLGAEAAEAVLHGNAARLFGL